MAGDMAQVVEHFPRKNKALSSNNSTIPLKLDFFLYVSMMCLIRETRAYILHLVHKRAYDSEKS
jgi:hypothetical protein